MNPKDFYNRTSGVYDIKHDSPATRLVRKKEKQLLKRFSSGLVLDFGCGTGHHLPLMENAIGSDVSSKMLKRALGKGKPLLLADENLPLRSKSVDVVASFSVLNVCDYEKAVKEFARVLKSGGLVIISVASFFDNKKSKTKKMSVCKQSMQLWLFDKKELLGIFQKNGFSLTLFDSLFTLYKPRWGSFKPLTAKERLALLLEKLLPKETGSVYFAVFKKNQIS